MPAPIFFRKMVLLLKLEGGGYAVDPTLTGAANAILAQNISIKPMEGQDVGRNLILPYLGNQASIPTGLFSVIEFDTEIAGSGVAGTAPAWGPLMRASGMAEAITPDTSVAYNPISDSMESAWIKFWLGGTLHALRGVRGGGKATLNAQGVPNIHWTFTGLYTDPSEAAAANPTLTAFQKPLIVSKANTPTFTINGVALVMRNFSLDFGNKVEPRLPVNKEEVLITDRNEAIDATVEAVPVSTLDIYGIAKNQTQVAVNLVHGTAAGNIATISAPKCQIQRPSGYQQNQGIADWPLRLTPQPNAGNDQFSITLT